MSDNYDTREFDGVQSLMAIANDPRLQADEQPVFTYDHDADPDAGTEALEGVVKAENGGALPIGSLEGHKAVYNPATGRLFDVVTDDYEIINPGQFIGPMLEELNDRDRTDITGRVRVFDGGARCYTELLFEETESIWLPDSGRSDPVRCGFTIRWSHDGGLSVRVEGFAQDTACQNSMRAVTAPMHIKHAGDVDDRIDWGEEWADALDELGAFSDALAGIIEESMSHDMFDFSETDMAQPFSPAGWRDVTDPLDTLEATTPPGSLDENRRDTLYAFYELIGFPSYLGVTATERLMARLRATDDPRVISAWDVYSAATYALTHEFRGDVGRSDDDKHRMASDILMNPQRAIEEADREAQSRRVEASGDDARLSGIETQADPESDVGEALRAYSERSRELESTFGG